MNLINSQLNSQYSIENSSNRLKLIIRWNKKIGLIICLVSVVFILIGFFLLADTLNNSSQNSQIVFPFEKIFNTIFVAFPFLFMAIAFLVLLFGISNLVNKTILEIKNGYLSISHQPFPILRNKIISTYDIQQIYVKNYYSFPSSKSEKNDFYSLHYIDRTGSTDILLGNLFGFNVPYLSFKTASEIEKTIETFLNIKNEPVSGEAFINKPTSKTTYNDLIFENDSLGSNLKSLPNPKSLVVDESNGLFISKKWLHFMVIFHMFFVLLVNCFTALFAYFILYNFYYEIKVQIIGLLFLSPFIVYGINYLLNTLSLAFNTTTITFNTSEFKLEHYPIKYNKSVIIPRSDIQKFDQIIKTRYTRNGVYKHKILVALLKNGKKIIIQNNSLLTFRDEEVQYLKEKLNRALFS